MPITEQSHIGTITVESHGSITVTVVTDVLRDDGAVIASTTRRRIFAPLSLAMDDPTDDNSPVTARATVIDDQDLGIDLSSVRAIAKVAWTPDVVKAQAINHAMNDIANSGLLPDEAARKWGLTVADVPA